MHGHSGQMQALDAKLALAYAQQQPWCMHVRQLLSYNCFAIPMSQPQLEYNSLPTLRALIVSHAPIYLLLWFEIKTIDTPLHEQGLRHTAVYSPAGAINCQQ